MLFRSEAGSRDDRNLILKGISCHTARSYSYVLAIRLQTGSPSFTTACKTWMYRPLAPIPVRLYRFSRRARPRAVCKAVPTTGVNVPLASPVAGKSSPPASCSMLTRVDVGHKFVMGREAMWREARGRSKAGRTRLRWGRRPKGLRGEGTVDSDEVESISMRCCGCVIRSGTVAARNSSST